MSKCPRCGTRVDDGLFAICPRCGATPGASGSYRPDVTSEQVAPVDEPQPAIFGEPPGVPALARTLSRLVVGLVLVGIVVGLGAALFSATVGGDDGNGSAEIAAAEPEAVEVTEPAQAEPAATTGAGAASTGDASTSRSESSCTRLWNAAVNEGARDGVAALGAESARVRASSTACVVVVILPGPPATATRFVAEDRAYAPAGPAARVPSPNATFDAAGRLRRQ